MRHACVGDLHRGHEEPLQVVPQDGEWKVEHFFVTGGTIQTGIFGVTMDTGCKGSLVIL